MDALTSVSRVGGLAVALGVGAALVTGQGLAYADSTDAGASPDPQGNSEPSTPDRSSHVGAEADAPAGEADAPAGEADAAPDSRGNRTSGAPRRKNRATAARPDDGATVELPRRTRSQADSDSDPSSQSAVGRRALAWLRDTDVDAAAPGSADPVRRAAPTTPDAVIGAVRETVAILAPRAASSVATTSGTGPAPAARVTPQQVTSRLLSLAGVRAPGDDTPDPVPPPMLAALLAFARRDLDVTAGLDTATLPSLRLWPTAFDPFTPISYSLTLASDLLDETLRPFANGLPPLPDPTPAGIVEWLGQEFFHPDPVIDYDPTENVQTQVPDGDVFITGSIGPPSTEDNPVTYTVIGRPLNGGEVEVNEDGTFTYRPMNAMAAVGGTDSFIVVADDSVAGLHNHGPLGLLQFVPILGNIANPGGGHRVSQTITVTVAPATDYPVDLSFPADFHWGVAGAGFQVEGGPNSPVDPNSDWYKWVHSKFNQLLGLTEGVPEDGPGEYNLYPTDAQLASDELGMNTFRFSIEWSRIFPESTAAVDMSDPDALAQLQALADPDEVEHYHAVLDALQANGLEPVVTVNHFTLPTWINDPTANRALVQAGLPASSVGWLSETTPVEFEKYAAFLASEYGDQVDTWVVLNEPVPPQLTQYLSPPIPGSPIPHWPPGVLRPDLASTFLVNEATGHVAAYDAIHAWDANGTASVGFANNMIPGRPNNPENPLDVKAADYWNSLYNVWFPNAVIDGWVDTNLDGTPDEFHPEWVDKADFIGVQYYGAGPMTGFGVAPVPGLPWMKGFPVQCDAASPTCSDFGQPTDPGGFREVLDIATSYGKPVWITENGIADANDSKRPSYIVNHIAVVQDMVAHGADIKGYTYWSFVDNLEWSEGYRLKFGLYQFADTPDRTRIPKEDSVNAISAITKLNKLPIPLLDLFIPGE